MQYVLCLSWTLLQNWSLTYKTRLLYSIATDFAYTRALAFYFHLFFVSFICSNYILHLKSFSPLYYLQLHIILCRPIHRNKFYTVNNIKLYCILSTLCIIIPNKQRPQLSKRMISIRSCCRLLCFVVVVNDVFCFGVIISV